MAKLIGHGVETNNNIFTLYGEHEDAATHGVGCLLARSPTFLEMFMKSLEKDTNIHGKDMEKIKIELQKHRKDPNPVRGKKKKPSGRTDIEVGIEDDFCLIIEAKRWGPVIGKGQLKKYADLLTEKDGKVCFMTLSRSDKRPHSKISTTSVTPGKDFPVIHRSWGEIRELVKQASEQTRKSRNNNDLENILLTDLYIHLENYVHYEEGNVCVVYLNDVRKTPEGHTYREIVTKGGGYFHPYTNDYPERAPKYLGFRWDGALQRVHKVASHSIGQAFPSTGNGELPEGELMWQENYNHMIYTLEKENLLEQKIGEGETISSAKLTGPRAKQHWCDFKFLQSGELLQEAIEKTVELRKEEKDDRIKKAQENLRRFLGGK